MVQKQLALVGATAEAEGHPTECQEPAPGTIESTAPCSLSVNGVQVAAVNTAAAHFASHAHDYRDTDSDGTLECTDMASHDVTALDSGTSVTLNGNPVFTVDSGVASDPTTGGAVNIVSSGGNGSVSEAQ